jgi:hypothetical protein
MRIAWSVSLALLVSAALAGCASDGGQASVYVKDAPADDWQAIHITFTEVAVHQSGGNDTSGWKTLFSDSAGVTVDLLNTTGARAAFLGETGLAAGHYQQIRIYASSAHGIRKDGTGVDIALPEKGYVHTSKSFKVEAGKETQIVIDIDLEKSLVLKGGQWEFKPKIGKVYTAIKEKDGKPDKGDVENVELRDDA